MSRRAAGAEVMATRVAVARALDDLDHGAPVLVACSGGADSLALVAAAAWCARDSAYDVSAVVVDHGLQADSADVADAAASACEALGLAAQVRRVEVEGPGGPEAAARAARYGALTEAAAEVGTRAVLLGHTREDQAETVLLRLARGSGARTLSAMSPETGIWRRPFLDLTRDVVRTAASDVLTPMGRAAWADPHNEIRDYARVRVRSLLDALVTDLGPGVVLGLARSADLLRDDADALDAMADEAFDALVRVDGPELSADADALARLPRAVRTRVERRMALAGGSVAEALGVDHIRAVDALVVAWRGQGETRLPGGVVVRRSCGRLCLRSA